MTFKTLPCGRKINKKTPPSKEDLLKYKEKLRKYTTQKQKKFTEQRWQIAEVILKEGGHSKVQDILTVVQSHYPHIGAATVYRNIKTLCDAGILIESHMNEEGIKYFEIASKNHHDHILCLDCGEIIEFKNDQIESLQKDLCNKMHFEAEAHRHMIMSRCTYLKK